MPVAPAMPSQMFPPQQQQQIPYGADYSQADYTQAGYGATADYTGYDYYDYSGAQAAAAMQQPVMPGKPILVTDNSSKMSLQRVKHSMLL